MPRKPGEPGEYSSGLSRKVERVRLPESAESEVVIDEAEKKLILETAQNGRDILAKHFMPGLGVIPSENNKGAYEILDPKTGKPAVSRMAGLRTYTPPKNFMGSWAAFLGAYEQVVKLGWIKTK